MMLALGRVVAAPGVSQRQNVLRECGVCDRNGAPVNLNDK